MTAATGSRQASYSRAGIVLRWLEEHPLELDTLARRAATEADVAWITYPDAEDKRGALQYLRSVEFRRCGWCYAELALFPDDRALDFPRLVPHRCPPGWNGWDEDGEAAETEARRRARRAREAAEADARRGRRPRLLEGRP